MCVHLPSSDRSHRFCHSDKLSSLATCLLIEEHRHRLRRSSAMMSMGTVPEMTHTASSEAVRYADKTLRALSQFTDPIFLAYVQVLSASVYIGNAYKTINQGTLARSFLLLDLAPPIFSIMRERDAVTSAALSLTQSMWSKPVVQHHTQVFNHPFGSQGVGERVGGLDGVWVRGGGSGSVRSSLASKKAAEGGGRSQ